MGHSAEWEAVTYVLLDCKGRGWVYIGRGKEVRFGLYWEVERGVAWPILGGSKGMAWSIGKE